MAGYVSRPVARDTILAWFVTLKRCSELPVRDTSSARWNSGGVFMAAMRSLTSTVKLGYSGLVGPLVADYPDAGGRVCDRADARGELVVVHQHQYGDVIGGSHADTPSGVRPAPAGWPWTRGKSLPGL